MNDEQLKRARDLKAEGKSFRQIAKEIGISLVSVWRALGGQGEEEEPGGEPPLSAREGQSIDTKPSALIAARIQEAKARLREVETALAQFPAEKEAILGAEEISHAALDTIEAQEAHLTREAEHLLTRLPLLEKQREEIEKAEAQGRLAALPAEAEGLREGALISLLGWMGAEQKLLKFACELGEVYRKRRELGNEEVFLVERFGLPRARLVELDEPPKFAELQQSLGQIWYEAQNTPSPWAEKRRQWQERRRRGEVPRSAQPRAAAPPAPPPQEFSVELPEPDKTGTVTINGREVILKKSWGFNESWTLTQLAMCARKGELQSGLCKFRLSGSFLTRRRGRTRLCFPATVSRLPGVSCRDETVS